MELDWPAREHALKNSSLEIIAEENISEQVFQAMGLPGNISEQLDALSGARKSRVDCPHKRRSEGTSRGPGDGRLFLQALENEEARGVRMTSRRYVPVREIDHFVSGEVVDLPLDLKQEARVTLVLRPRTPHRTMREHLDRMAGHLPHQRHYFTREEFAHQYGATEEDLAVVAAFAGEHNLEVAEISHARRRLVLKGKLDDLSRAFKVKFVHLHDPDHGVYRSHLEPVHVPAELKPVIQAVMGFSARAHHGHPAMSASRSARRLVDPRKVAKTYQFPAGCTGRGQTIGIIALGGGFHESDLDAYFRHLGMRKPKITVVEIEGQENNPADPEAIRDCLARSGAAGLHRAKGQSHPDRHVRRNSDKNVEWTLETTMDVELIGTWANGAHIVVYFTHNNARGKYEAFNAALHDTTYKPNVISCSWGAPEKLISHVLEEEMDLMFQAAALMGVTIVCASGDHGDGSAAAGQPQAYFPASSPHVLACGGTVLRHAPGEESVEKRVARKRCRSYRGERVRRELRVPRTELAIGSGYRQPTRWQGRSGRRGQGRFSMRLRVGRRRSPCCRLRNQRGRSPVGEPGRIAQRKAEDQGRTPHPVAV